MNRRNVLLGIASVATLASTRLVLAAPAPLNRPLFRWSTNGRVYYRDAGRWVESIGLGQDVQIINIEETSRGATLTAASEGRRFQLHTLNGRHWRT